MPLSGHNDATIDSLRLSDWEREALLTQMNRQSSESYGVELRQDERLPYQVGAGVVVKLHHPGGSTANYLVRPRNISQRGMGFLHGNFLYVGSRCSAQLHTRVAGTRITAEGKIVRCQHVRGHVHEVGMRFEQPIDVNLFVEGCLRSSGESEQSTELPQIRGRVLYVEDLVDDQELLRYHLGNLGVDIMVACDALEAMERMEDDQFDLVMTGMALPGMSGAEFIQALRQSGYRRPIIALTSDCGDHWRDEALARGCTEVLTKPYSFEALIDLLVRHLPMCDQAGSPTELLLSTEWHNSRMRPLILNFIGRLERTTRCMESLLDTDDNEAVLHKMCMDLKGSAGGYGYPQISVAAQQLAQLALDHPEAETLKRQFEVLSQLVQAACLVRQETARR